MSLPNSLRAYEDCRQLFEASVADPKGARANLGSYEDAIQMRTRLHYYRKLDREANATIYPAGHPQHGTSLYDEYVVQIYPDPDGNHWVYIQPRGAKILQVEGLSDVDELIEAESTEVHLIEDQSNAQT